MAELHKSRARKPLAVSGLSYSWGRSGNADATARFGFGVNGETHSYRLNMTRSEALGVVGYIAGHETFEPGHVQGFSDKRTLAQRLRDLADKLEGER